MDSTFTKRRLIAVVIRENTSDYLGLQLNMNSRHECVIKSSRRVERNKDFRGKGTLKNCLIEKFDRRWMWDTRPNNRSQYFGIQISRFLWLQSRISSNYFNWFINCSSIRLFALTSKGCYVRADSSYALWKYRLLNCYRFLLKCAQQRNG